MQGSYAAAPGYIESNDATRSNSWRFWDKVFQSLGAVTRNDLAPMVHSCVCGMESKPVPEDLRSRVGAEGCSER